MAADSGGDGIDVTAQSTAREQARASAAFVRAWDYGFVWNIAVHGGIFEELRTKMGHAVYEDGGVDYSGDVGELFADPEDVFAFDLFEAFGRRDARALTDMFNDNYAAMQAWHTDCVNMTGVYVTCMSGLIELLGWNTLLMAAGINARAFGDFTNRYCAWIQQYFDALARCDAPVVMVHDDIVWTSGAFLAPAFYREFIFPNYRRLFAPLHEAGKIILYTSDGAYTQFVDDIAACGVNGFVLEPTTDLAYVARRYGKTHAIVGNHIPANTPVDNALYYNDCFEEMRKR